MSLHGLPNSGSISSCHSFVACRKGARPSIFGVPPHRHRDPPRRVPVDTGTRLGPDRPRSCGLDFDRPRRRGVWRGNPHLEHALSVLRLHVGGVDALRKGEIPLERAVRDFTDEIVLARAVVIGLTLPFDGEHVVHQGHPNILGIHARQGELDDVGAVLDPPLRGGKPRRTLSDFIPGAGEEPLEQVVGLVVEVELPCWRPAKHGVHDALLLTLVIIYTLYNECQYPIETLVGARSRRLWLHCRDEVREHARAPGPRSGASETSR